ncbi:MAG: hypothetical protein AAF846_05095 [Chloroflexota bacterium]
MWIMSHFHEGKKSQNEFDEFLKLFLTSEWASDIIRKVKWGRGVVV